MYPFIAYRSSCYLFMAMRYELFRKMVTMIGEKKESGLYELRCIKGVGWGWKQCNGLTSNGTIECGKVYSA
jgi:hypothetical protein